MTELLAVAGTSLVLVAIVLLIVRVSSRRTVAAQQRPTVIPSQRSPLTQAELLKLNQEYGAGRVGEAEYARRRKELLFRVE